MTPSPPPIAPRAHRAERPAPAAGDGARLTFLACAESVASAKARAAQGRCPACARPGYVTVERIGGLPCAGCGRREERPLDEVASYAAAAECPRCNP